MPDDLGFAAYYVLGGLALIVGLVVLAVLVQLGRGIWRGLTGRAPQPEQASTDERAVSQ